MGGGTRRHSLEVANTLGGVQGKNEPFIRRWWNTINKKEEKSCGERSTFQEEKEAGVWVLGGSVPT